MQGNNSGLGPTALCQFNIDRVLLGYLFGLMILAIVILLTLAFFERRKRLHRCLWGFPGIIIPMNFLITPRYRFMYIVVFGLMSTSLFTTFGTIGTPPEINFYFGIIYTTLLVPLIIVLILALQYFPLFACINSAIPLLGHTIGFFYSILWFGYLVTFFIHEFVDYICQNIPPPTIVVLLQVASFLPIFGAVAIVTVWYGFKVIQGFLRLCGVGGKSLGTQQFICCGKMVGLKATDTPENDVKTYHVLHVQKLLNKQQSEKPQGKMKSFFIKAIKYLFPYSKDFRLPLPFVGAVFAMSMILYQFTITAIILAASLATYLPPIYNSFLQPLLAFFENATLTAAQTQVTNITTSQIQTVFTGIDEIFQLILVGLPAFLCVSPLVSLVLCLCLMINMVATVSKMLKRIAREGFKHVKLPSPTKRVPSSWKYVGYLLGFFTLAWFIYTLIVFLVLVAASIIYLGFRYLTALTVQVILYIFIPLIWSQLVLLLQSLICKFIFFEDQKGAFIAIKNSRLFNWFSYVLFFYNGIAGFVSAILRTLMSAGISLLLLFRMDQVVLMKGFEQLDFAHNGYLGFIYLSSTYNNAVMHVFIHLLKRETQTRPPLSVVSTLSDSRANLDVYRKLSTDSLPSVLSKSSGGRCARNRWLVAYTLIKNPSLQKLTAANIAANSDTEEVVTAEVETAASINS